MKKASASLFILALFAAMVTQVNAQSHYGQQGSAQGGYASRVITQRISQSLRMREVRRVSELLRLSMSESMELNATSITLSAYALRNQAQLEISSRGRLISSQFIGRQFNTITIQLPAFSRLDDLEISATDDTLIDTLTVLVESSRGGQHQDMQPMSGQGLRLDINQDIRMSGEIDLKRLVRQQLGLTLEGVQIERIAVQGQVFKGRSASVQVEMNRRLIGPTKMISESRGVTPIPLNSFEEVRSDLRLLIRGDVVITQIIIRVGQVRRTW